MATQSFDNTIKVSKKSAKSFDTILNSAKKTTIKVPVVKEAKASSLRKLFGKWYILEFQIVQLCDLLDEFGKDPVEKVLTEFSCPLNKDVEYFLHKKAILYENNDKSRTYLVFAIDEGIECFIAYFTIASLPITFEDSLSNKRKKKILGTGYESNSQLSAILIGQFSKNYTNNNNILITGSDLFNLAINKALQANKLIGGRIIYLECEDTLKLRSFYESVGLELYVDDNGDPILSDTGLLTYLISTRNISVSKKSAAINQITLK